MKLTRWFNTEPMPWMIPDVLIKDFRPFETWESPSKPADYFKPTLVMEDCFTYDGCYSINPITKESTGHLMIFREWPTVEDRWPAAVVDGPYKNCTMLPTGKRENLKIAKAVADWMVATNV